MDNRIAVFLGAFIAGTYAIIIGLNISVILIEVILIACCALDVAFFVWARAAVLMPLGMTSFALGMLLASIL